MFGSAQPACRVAACESKYDTGAVSPTNDHGLFQINEPTWNKPGHHDPVADWIGRNWSGVYSARVNMEMARRIVASYGWGMWSCA